jgi:hypothetical protein
MPAICLRDTIDALFASAQSCLDRQVDRPGHPDHGGPMNANWGIVEPSGGIGVVATLNLALIARRLRPELAPASPADEQLQIGAKAATEYLLRMQRPSGFTDLMDCNYDSSPDAGFAVQALCPVLELGARVTADAVELQPLLAQVETFCRRATEGMCTGGFHTPNHRWVIAAALARAGRLFPDIQVRPTIEAYLAEGIDADEEGFYIERSAGVYDAICDRSLLMIWDAIGHAPSRDAARRNLDLGLQLLNADGTTETGLSRRQDYGQRSVPPALSLAYLMGYQVHPDPRYLAAAQLLWDRGRGDGAGLTAFMLAAGVDRIETPSGVFPYDYAALFPTNGLWRYRRGDLSVSLFRDVTRLLTLTWGEAELAALKISQSYFGAGNFRAETLALADGHPVLVSSGVQITHRPGYDQPTGQPVARQTFYTHRGQRDWRQLPPCASELSLIPDADAILLRYRTLDGFPGVTAQMAFDFAPGGQWETADTCLRPVAGQVLFLKQGRGTMRYGHHVVEIDGGATAHRMWAMRDAETAPTHVRVLLTFTTPVDHAVHVRVRREP